MEAVEIPETQALPDEFEKKDPIPKTSEAVVFWQGPFELFAIIFPQVADWTDLCAARRTCKAWRNMLDSLLDRYPKLLTRFTLPCRNISGNRLRFRPVVCNIMREYRVEIIPLLPNGMPHGVCSSFVHRISTRDLYFKNGKLIRHEEYAIKTTSTKKRRPSEKKTRTATMRADFIAENWRIQFFSPETGALIRVHTPTLIKSYDPASFFQGPGARRQTEALLANYRRNKIELYYDPFSPEKGK
jgi:hypothetical protein